MRALSFRASTGSVDATTQVPPSPALTSEDTPAEPGGRRGAEHSLLLCCASVHPEDKRLQRVVQLLSHPLDWDYLLEAAHSHGLIPLLQKTLQDVNADSIPAAVAATLSNRFRVSAARGLLLTGELLALSELFQEHGVAWLPFKGPTLALLAYGNLALRPFNDLDILVRDEDIPKVAGLLRSRGYEPEACLNTWQEKMLRRCDHQYKFRHSGDRPWLVECHWRLLPPQIHFPLDFKALNAEAISVSVGGRTIRTFSAEDLLLFLSVHGMKHLWCRSLEWLCDIARLARLDTLHWEKVMEKSRRLECRSPVLLALFLANHWLGAELPPSVIRQTEESSTRRLADRVRPWLWSEVGAHPGHLGTLAFHMRAQDRLRDRFSACYYSTMTPGPEDWTSLSSPVHYYLYPLLRPIRIAGKNSRRWFR